MRRIGPAVVLLTALGLLITGCTSGGSGAATASPGTTPAAANPLRPFTDPAVLADCPAQPAGHLPSGLSASTISDAYTCTSDGTTETVSRITDVQPLLDAYATSDQAGAAGGVCPALAADPLIVWLHIGDTIAAVRAPMDGCSIPQNMAAVAFHTAPQTVVLTAKAR